jgi:hypothetical protein
VIRRFGTIKARVEVYTTCSFHPACAVCPKRYVTAIIARCWLSWR